MGTTCGTTCGTTTHTWPDAGQLPCLSYFATQQLEMCKEIKKPSTKGDDVDFGKFLTASEKFPIEFGTSSCRVKSQPVERRQMIRKQIASAYPIIHELTLLLYMNFLEHKQKYGTAQELSVFGNISITEFVQRLLSKRCVYFFDASDSYLLLDGSRGHGGFEQIGSSSERAPLLLRNVLSYDEIKLSALLYVSTHSEFINDGSRFNNGRVEESKSKIEIEGVIMGLIGARFERSNVMEWEDIMITPEQNKASRGYGASDNESKGRLQDYRRIWRDFYMEPMDFCFDDDVVASDNKRFINLGRNTYFDKVVMGKRFAISFDTLLVEAEARAVKAGKPAYVHVVGIGLGVWKAAPQQEEIFLETFEQRLRALSERLTHIGVVHFSWFHLDKWGGLYDGASIAEPKHPLGGIKVRIAVRNPADKLAENMLPIVTYAWDGNALPGNEFWAKSLSGSGDPAAACSTLISELQNAHINKDYMCGNNLHIATLEHGVLHIADYAEKLLA
ncbi:GH12722 [Drosophila grimshawi]|uniref:GH12722 n=2 Tax=Drosophila grimshawi TaxID=7222 RepID=B4JKR7_DROGR|nr:GH12722 [Drosophila grimshawi]